MKTLKLLIKTVSMCPCVCLSHSWILSKRINISSNFFHHPHHSGFFCTKRHGVFRREPPPPQRERRMQVVGLAEIVILSQYLASSHAVNAATS